MNVPPDSSGRKPMDRRGPVAGRIRVGGSAGPAAPTSDVRLPPPDTLPAAGPLPAAPLVAAPASGAAAPASGAAARQFWGRGLELVQVVGRGGMGVVYEARQTALNRTVAVKMLLHPGLLADPPTLARFRAEAEAVARLQHPGIVQLYDVGELGGQPYMVLEYAGGGTLADWARRGPVAADAAARAMAAVAAAVHHAHAKGIVHRDLKPNNILLTSDGQVKVTDFGVAKWLGGDDGLTATGAIVGTPAYMAPEQAQGRGPDIGPWTDVYSLGAILYELLTGRPPFQGESPLAVLQQLVSQPPVPPRAVAPGVPPAVEAVCLRCLEKSPRRRFWAASDVELALLAAVGAGHPAAPLLTPADGVPTAAPGGPWGAVAVLAGATAAVLAAAAAAAVLVGR